MPKINDLQVLIHALDGAESKYVINYISQGYRIKQSGIYIALFKKLATAKELSEDKLDKLIKKNGGRSRLGFYIKQLNELIQAALFQHQSKESKESRIQEMLNTEHIFSQKGLHDQCLSILEEAKELAHTYEYLYLEMEIIHRMRFLYRNIFPSDTEEKFNELISQKDALMLRLHNENQYRDLSDRVFILIRTYNELKSEDNKARLKHLMNNKLLHSENQALSTSARITFNYIHARHHKLMNDYATARPYRERIVELFEQNPYHLEDRKHLYLSALGNLLNNYHYLNNHNGALDLIKKMRQFQSEHELNNISTLQMIWNQEMLTLMNTGNFAKSQKVAYEIEAEITNREEQIQNSYELSISYNLFITFFFVEDYKRALQWINRIINLQGATERQDIQDFAKIFRLIVFYCTNDVDIIDHHIRSTKRLLKKKDRLYDLESIVIKRLKKLVNANQNATSLVYEGFQTEIKDLSKKIGEKTIGLEEIEIWLQSKILNKSMTEILNTKLAA